MSTAPPKCILVAEDNSNDVQLTLMALKKLNLPHTVVVASDGEEALNFLYYREDFKTRCPEDPLIIILDLKMPKLDGLEVLRKVKNDPKLKTIPVVMFTSSRQESDVMQSYQLGANAYVVKPVEFKQYTEAIKHIGTFWTLVNEPPPVNTLTFLEGDFQPSSARI